MRTPVVLLIALVAACATTDDRAILDELEGAAARSPRADLAARVAAAAPYRVVGEARPTTIALEPGKAPIVRGKVNGIEMPCILDTGTTHLVLSAAAARACDLYLPESAPIRLVTPGYDARFRVGAPETIELGGMRLEGGIAIVPEEASDVARRLGVRDEVHATIGTAVLSNFDVVFDFRERRVVLAPNAAEPFAGVMWTEVRVNGVPRLLLIDSGAHGIFLEPEFALELGLVDRNEARRLGTKAARAQSSRFGAVRLETVALGPRVFRDVDAHVVELMEDTERGGLLGIAGLGPHRWMVDYANRRLLLLEFR